MTTEEQRLTLALREAEYERDMWRRRCEEAESKLRDANRSLSEALSSEVFED